MSGYIGAAGIDLNLLALAALVKRLGGSVTITQAEMDAVAFSILHDCMLVDTTNGGWAMKLELQPPRANG